ncbi:MAG TPA: carboxylating nicotinate-nucleotide diphosphorylase [Nitriliruptorales bacterium]|nr:carboxylating nicotinate-nucleotide diphosphorylase [Nitriliruptorales bacterium]
MSDTRLVPPPALLYEPVVRRALREDLGVAGDLTTEAIVAPDVQATGVVAARSPGRVAAVTVAARAFTLLDRRVGVRPVVEDGKDVDAGQALAVVDGPAPALLTAERAALNLLSHLCGVATATRDVVTAVAASGARVVATRKTTPGLRGLERYAVRAGGGADHRFGLDDAVLIKDNHLVVAGSIAEAVDRVRRRVGHLVKIQVEVDRLDQLDAALAAAVDAVLLDNLPLDVLREAVRQASGHVVLEASGRITAQTAPDVAATGVDLLSVGWLTHSASALDIGLDLRTVTAA